MLVLNSQPADCTTSTHKLAHNHVILDSLTLHPTQPMLVVNREEKNASGNLGNERRFFPFCAQYRSETSAVRIVAVFFHPSSSYLRFDSFLCGASLWLHASRASGGQFEFIDLLWFCEFCVLFSYLCNFWRLLGLCGQLFGHRSIRRACAFGCDSQWKKNEENVCAL